ncbi:family 43 glycosylhydrolase [Microbacterium sp. NIBRBAC000506063]|uniref:family 43 glycosylhydrolase n=1 Tax=Microbacterium sp. NIBRBAC000506063 TaxID=2734618 RepID=UPI001BB69754|nr:glycoside hydrolase family 68 protein [Microbacterium sp. NIBRBAC000506063]QTV79819.1 family 43 glycosylhydrolase [Microbacterium sp. NIBRBAC000506063]
MFDLPDSWVWDFWFADDGTRYHLFFLYASRALHDPDARHHRASIGHAVSDDLVSWTRVADALVRGDAPAFDELATWTGSVVRHPDGRWFMFYTGARLESGGRNVQRIGYAISHDLHTWTKSPDSVLEADGRWYERIDSSQWHDEAFRDPWVFADPDGEGWHMFVTARANEGPVHGRGVVGHAVSDDLETWRLREPLSSPSDAGFGQLEVMQSEIVDGRPVLLFSCLGEHSSPTRRARFPKGAVWAVPSNSLTGPFDVGAAHPIADDELYVGRLVRRRDEEKWLFIAFRHLDDEGRFVGGVTDPRPVAWEGDRLVVG